MIDLLNRRGVAFFFNVGSGQPGYDAAAAKFIAERDPRFSDPEIPTPPVWIIAPDGKVLEQIDNYEPKDVFFQTLLAVLQKYPEYNQPTKEEQALFDAAKAGPDNPAARLNAAVLHEELGDYAAAGEHYAAVRTLKENSAEAARAALAQARIARHQKNWPAVAAALKSFDELNPGDRFKLNDGAAVERAYALLVEKKYAEARELLSKAIKQSATSIHIGEMHFYAGVAAWFMKEKDWANFHWCWVMKNAPDDRMYMRAYIAATAESMPYPNPELDGYHSSSNMISHKLADAAHDKAMLDYERLKEKF